MFSLRLTQTLSMYEIKKNLSSCVYFHFLQTTLHKKISLRGRAGTIERNVPVSLAPLFIEIHDNSLDVALFTVTNPKVTVFSTHSLTDIFGTTSWFLIAWYSPLDSPQYTWNLTYIIIKWLTFSIISTISIKKPKYHQCTSKRCPQWRQPLEVRRWHIGGRDSPQGPTKWNPICCRRPS